MNLDGLPVNTRPRQIEIEVFKIPKKIFEGIYKEQHLDNVKKGNKFP